jgi:hypothetical protein
MKSALAISAGILLLSAAPSHARADLVVFTDGRVVKAESVHVNGGQVEIRLPDGGGYSVDRSRVEKIVSDEVEGTAKADGKAPAPVQQPRPVEAAPRLDGAANVTMASSEPAASKSDTEPPKKSPKWSLRRGRHRR